MKLAKREKQGGVFEAAQDGIHASQPDTGHDFKRLVVVEQERRSRQDRLITPVTFTHPVAAIGRKARHSTFSWLEEKENIFVDGSRFRGHQCSSSGYGSRLRTNRCLP
jgi:hypothetical protein